MKYKLPVAVVLFAISSMGAGCTVNEWSLNNGAKVYVNAPSIAENRCDELLTMGRAIDLAGVEFTNRKASMSSRYTHIFDYTDCDFFMVTTGDNPALMIRAYVEGTPEKTQKAYDFWNREGQPISDLGDQAQWVPGLYSVYVMVGGIRLAVSSTTIDHEILESIARDIVPKLDASDWAKQMREFRG